MSLWFHPSWTSRVCRRSCPGQGYSLTTTTSSAGSAPFRIFSGVQIKKAETPVQTLDMWITAGIPEFVLHKVSDKGDLTGNNFCCHLFYHSFLQELLQWPNAATDHDWISVDHYRPQHQPKQVQSQQSQLPDLTAGWNSTEIAARNVPEPKTCRQTQACSAQSDKPWRCSGCHRRGSKRHQRWWLC